MSSLAAEFELLEDIQTARYALAAVYAFTAYDYRESVSDLWEAWSQRLDSFGLLTCYIFGSVAYVLTIGDVEQGKRFSWTTLVYALLRYAAVYLTAMTILLSLSTPLSDQRCYELYALSQTSTFAVVLLLQGMLATRVYILLENSRKVLLSLTACFIADQVLSLVSFVSVLSVGPKLVSEVAALGETFCLTTIPDRLTWAIPVGAAASLAFEMVLSVYALCYIFKHATRSPRGLPAMSSSALATTLVRDNILYFVIALLSMIVKALQLLPSLQLSIAFASAYSITLSLLMVRLGPWMILNLRRRHEKDVSGLEEITEMATVQFANPPPAEYYEEDIF